MKECDRISKVCFFGQKIFEVEIGPNIVRFRFPEGNENWIIFGKRLWNMFPPIGGWDRISV